MKERMIVQDLRSFIDKKNASCPIALIAGMRRVGKTTVLKQLQKYYPEAIYIDLSGLREARDLLDDFLADPKSVLFLDEITYLDNYENVCQFIYNEAGGDGEWKFKVVITGSSPAHISKLACTKLGGGRSKLFYLPIISFVEYLFFTDRISSYKGYDKVTSADFKDYLQLKGLKPELALSFDSQYFIDFYDTNVLSNQASHVNRSITELEKQDLLNIASLLAYQLAETPTYSVIMNPSVGELELRNMVQKEKRKALILSDALISKSIIGIKEIAHEDRARMIAFLLDSRIANIGSVLYSTDDNEISAQSIYQELAVSSSKTDLDRVFNKASIAINTPLLYTRLGDDILQLAGLDMCRLLLDNKNNDLLGKMLEVYIRGALSQYGIPLVAFSSVKLNYPEIGEVDICLPNEKILCEVTAGKKSLDKINVTKYYKGIPCIRICTTQGHEDFSNGFYRISYAKLCCMIDTKDILKLEMST